MLCAPLEGRTNREKCQWLRLALLRIVKCCAVNDESVKVPPSFGVIYCDFKEPIKATSHRLAHVSNDANISVAFFRNSLKKVGNNIAQTIARFRNSWKKIKGRTVNGEAREKGKRNGEPDSWNGKKSVYLSLSQSRVCMLKQNKVDRGWCDDDVHSLLCSFSSSFRRCETFTASLIIPRLASVTSWQNHSPSERTIQNTKIYEHFFSSMRVKLFWL